MANTAMEHRFQVCFLAFMVLQDTVPGTQEASGLSEDRRVIVKDYIRYRNMVGCEIDLCFPELQENITYPSLLKNNDSTVKSDVETDNCCGRCACDDDCSRRGNCCPDANLDHRYPVGGIYIYFRNLLKNKEVGGLGSRKHYRIIGKCMRTYQNVDVRKQCESPVGRHLDRFVPVSSRQASDSYRNIHCAECNWVPKSSLVPWDVKAACVKTQLRNVTSENIIDSVQSSDDCNMEFIPPAKIRFDKVIECGEAPKRNCNASRKWLHYNKYTEYACNAYEAPFYLSYRNIFCFICNTGSETNLEAIPDCLEGQRPKICSSNPNGLTPSFSALFVFWSVEAMEELRSKPACPEDFLLDTFKGICRQLFCEDTFHHQLVDGSCVLRRKFQALPYVALFHLQSIGITMHESTTAQGAQTAKPKATFAVPIIQSASRLLEKSLKSCDNCSWNFQKVTDDQVLSNDAALGPYDQMYSSTYFLIVEFHGEQNFETVLDLDGKTLDIDVGNNHATDHFEITLIQTHVIQLSNATHHLILFSIPTGFFTIPFITCNISRASCNFIQMTRFTKCPVLELSKAEFNANVTDAGLYLQQLNATLQSGHYRDVTDDIIKVCVETFMQILEEVGSNETSKIPVSTDFNHISSYLTVVCSAVSIVCCMITVLVYSVFGELRTQPGINNMILSLFILIGHALFIFGMNKTSDEIACKIIGGLFHFVWLSVIFWTGVCSFHMFKVFRNRPMQHSRHGHKATTFWYNIVCMSLSLVFIAINCVVTYIKSGTRKQGYGSEMGFCWISDPLMVLVTMFGPALAMVICNLFVFIVVAYQIKSAAIRDQTTVVNRNFFNLYAKLSTVTGFTWLSFIPYYLTNLEVFEYISIILYVNQGTFIMVAFVCNERMFKLIKNKWNRRSQSNPQANISESMKTTSLSGTMSSDRRHANKSVDESSSRH